MKSYSLFPLYFSDKMSKKTKTIVENVLFPVSWFWEVEQEGLEKSLTFGQWKKKVVLKPLINTIFWTLKKR